MVIFEKFRAIWAFIGAALCAAIPVMVQFTPAAVYSGLRPWLAGLLVLAAVLALYTLLAVVYGFGLRRGAASANVIAPATPADPQGRTVDDLIYAARTITTALLEAGEFRDGAVRSQMAQLERAHRAWHAAHNLQARDYFLATARRARKARELPVSWMAGGGMHYGELPAEQRQEFQARLTQERDALVLGLQALQLVEYGVAGPEVIEVD